MSLSIIIPVYNGEKYLEECIESVKKELMHDDEVIIVDDGSTDNTRLICEKYKNDKRFTVIPQQNRGVSQSRNKGIRQSQKEYLMFVDADDQLASGWRSTIKKAESAHYDVVLFGATKKTDLKKGEWLNCIFGLSDLAVGVRGPWSKIYSRDFVVREGIKFCDDIINGEDMLFNIEVLLAAKKYLFVRNSVYLYRNNSDSCSKQFNPAIFESDKKFQSYLSKIDGVTQEQKNKCVKDAIVMFVKKLSSIRNRVERKEYTSIFAKQPYQKFVFGKREVDRKTKLYCIVARYNLYNVMALFDCTKRKMRKREKEASLKAI